MSSVILLGPQGPRPNLPQTLAALDIPGPIATVTAGWEERETDDLELDQDVGGQTVNLRLFHRWVDVLDRDPELHQAIRVRDALLHDLHETYNLRLDFAMQAVYAVQQRPVRATLREGELDSAIQSVRDLDDHHFRTTREVYDEFYDRFPPHERAAVVEHRTEVAGLIGDCATLAIAGGHVGVLQACLHIFNVAAALGDRSVVAWSAGAMAVSEKIVLFHDRAPQGAGHAELFDAGIGLCRGVLPFPDARRRLRLDDPARMSVLARRFAPLTCLPLDEGTTVVLGRDDDGCPSGVTVIDADGRVAAAA